ncbi:MAG: LuxR C-terminal-related transcriptional regulator [Bacteroidetes bacterium]|uniref:LuxR C-terminal-related transcriptional regulator n=1 Tax=Phnomibacter sp. TaxID=2836217 RepID=UPI002FDEB4D6|nr:LuxR C-terminal-related transcriptional regulator [Bacteroidota bacterium]
MALPVAHSYCDLLKLAKNHELLEPLDTQELIDRLGFQNLSQQSQAPVLYIADYSKNKYLYIDPSAELILGFKNSWLADSGPSFFVSLMHPDDFHILSKKITPVNLQFLKTFVKKEYGLYSFTINFRLKSSNGTYRKFIQRHSYPVVDKSGIPIIVAGFIIDVTHFKKDNSIIHTIEKIASPTMQAAPELIYKNVYFPSSTKSAFSERELEVLMLILEGLGNKVIADKLNISIHTIRNHRKSLLRKSGASTVTELIRYAIDNGLLESI